MGFFDILHWVSALCGVGQKFEFVKQMLAGRKDCDAVPARAMAIIFCVDDLRKIGNTAEKCFVVCKDRERVFVDNRLPEQLKNGEVCWVLPRDDVRIVVVINSEEKDLVLNCSLSFEITDSIGGYKFAAYLNGKTALTEEQLAALLVLEWNTFIQWAKSAGIPFPPIGQTFSNNELAALRAHFSNFLSDKYGIRCTGLSAEWQERAIVTPTETISQQEATPEKRQQTDKAESEIEQAVRVIWTVRGWERVMQNLDSLGYKPSPDAAAELDILRCKYLGREITAKETAKKIADMILNANNRSIAVLNNLAYWDSAATAARILEAFEGKQNIFNDTTAALPITTPASSEKFAWFKSVKQIDNKLLGYVSKNVSEMSQQIDILKPQLDFRQIAALQPVKAVLDRLEQHLRQMPPLTGEHKSFRKRQIPLSETLEVLQLTVPAVQLATGMFNETVRELSNLTAEQAVPKIQTLTAALIAVEKELENRKNIYR